MTIEFIHNGVANVAAAEKIKLVIHEKREETNPFLDRRAKPDDSEGFKSGGGTYRFQSMIGYDKAERRTVTPTSSTVNYNGVTEVSEKVLKVLMPLETKKYPFSSSDTLQLDKIDFPAKASGKVSRVLVKSEIQVDSAVISNVATATTKIDGTSAITSLEQLQLLKQVSATFLDIDNDDQPERAKYFDAQKGSYEKGEVKIYLHPAKVAFLSDVNTEAGAGSALQFAQFEDGLLSKINGMPVVVTKWVDKASATFIPPEMIGTPDEEIMGTKVIDFYDEGNDVDVVWGKHYYDSILIAPELVTVVTLADETLAVATASVNIDSIDNVTSNGGSDGAINFNVDVLNSVGTVTAILIPTSGTSALSISEGANAGLSFDSLPAATDYEIRILDDANVIGSETDIEITEPASEQNPSAEALSESNDTSQKEFDKAKALADLQKIQDAKDKITLESIFDFAKKLGLGIDMTAVKNKDEAIALIGKKLA